MIPRKADAEKTHEVPEMQSSAATATKASSLSWELSSPGRWVSNCGHYSRTHHQTKMGRVFWSAWYHSGLVDFAEVYVHEGQDSSVIDAKVIEHRKRMGIVDPLGAPMLDGDSGPLEAAHLYRVARTNGVSVDNLAQFQEAEHTYAAVIRSEVSKISPVVDTRSCKADADAWAVRDEQGNLF